VIAGGPIPAADGRLRCPWALAAPEYLGYHDNEWGRPAHGDDVLYERLTLEAFQSGLSWLTILRKREAFRAAFDGFSLEKVAEYGPTDVDRLLGDTGIVRNRAKVSAAITNARAALAVAEGLDALLWSYAPDRASRPAPQTLADVPPVTDESSSSDPPRCTPPCKQPA
jgi:DNA-3-methyladenine glycosylase I